MRYKIKTTVDFRAILTLSALLMFFNSLLFGGILSILTIYVYKKTVDRMFSYYILDIHIIVWLFSPVSYSGVLIVFFLFYCFFQRKSNFQIVDDYSGIS